MKVIQPIQNKGYDVYQDKFYLFHELQFELMTTENSMSLRELRATVITNQDTLQHKAETRVRLQRNQVVNIADIKNSVHAVNREKSYIYDRNYQKETK